VRIAQVATLSTPVRQDGAGSVESLVHLLARELVERGHEVTVFACGTSTPPCELVAALPGPYHDERTPDDWQLCEWINVTRAIEESHRFDLLHSHSYLNALPLVRLARCPLVNTSHILPYDGDGRVVARYHDAHLTAISAAQWARFADVHPAAVIPHGLDASAHTFTAIPGDYLFFLGRFTHAKGPLEAIAAARDVGMPLRMAGPWSEILEREIKPYVDGDHVVYDGPIGTRRRDELLGGARALVYPIKVAEPFGLVMVEAMLSGTPVAAYKLGAVGEIVEEGVTGFTVEPGDDLAGAVRRCLELDRRVVRERAAERFSSTAMVDAYERLYERVATAVTA
jgi:glycosyltransferase involved in cell wall biosynthesis